MANEEIERLRQEVARRQRAAGQKISRLRKRGVEISGTQFDVRRDPSKLKSYNRNQLRAQLTRVNNFVNRGNQFVAGDSGAPIPRNRWQEYKRQEAMFNAKGSAHFEKVADTFIPATGFKLTGNVDKTKGLTVRQRETMRADKPKAAGEVANRAYYALDRSPRNVTGADSVETLIQDLKNRNSKKYLPQKISNSRREFMEMLKTMGNHELMEQAARLQDDQFDVLWNYTSFATDIGLEYDLRQLQSAGREQAFHENILENDTGSAFAEILQWAEFLPTKGRTKT
jgi:hypothetical protein